MLHRINQFDFLKAKNLLKKKFKITTRTVIEILLIKFGICKTLNNSINPKNSTIIVTNLAEKNLIISAKISFAY